MDNTHTKFPLWLNHYWKYLSLYQKILTSICLYFFEPRSEMLVISASEIVYPYYNLLHSPFSIWDYSLMALDNYLLVRACPTDFICINSVLCQLSLLLWYMLQNCNFLSHLWNSAHSTRQVTSNSEPQLPCHAHLAS